MRAIPSNFKSSSVLNRFIAGALLGIAVYFIEAGIAEILLARDAECIAALNRMRFRVASRLVCLSDFEIFLLESLSKGFFRLVQGEVGALLVRIGMGGFYGLVAGTLAQVTSRWSWGAFIGINLLVVLIVSLLAYMKTFIL